MPLQNALPDPDDHQQRQACSISGLPPPEVLRSSAGRLRFRTSQRDRRNGRFVRQRRQSLVAH